MIFSERLRYLIDCEDIKIKVLAPKLNLAASTLGNYAQGTREPDFETLVRIADYFGVTTDYLLGHEMPAQAGAGEKNCLLCCVRCPLSSVSCCWSRRVCWQSIA